MRAPSLAAILGLALLTTAAGPAPAPAPVPTSATDGAAIAPSPTLADVRRAGKLSCGAVAEPEDWGKDDLHGNIASFDIEICKAIAVATLGSDAKLAMHLYASAIEAGAGLRHGEVSVAVGLTPNATAVWRDGIRFGAPVFYDGLSVLVRGDSPARRVSELGGHKICYVENTDNALTVPARTRARGVNVMLFPFQEEGEMEDGLADRHCDAIAADVTHLAIERASNPKGLGRDRILDDWMTIAPMAVATRDGDPQWALITDWTVYALEQAEALGVTRANVGSAGKGASDPDPALTRLLGDDWAASRALGLADHHWAAKVIAVVGNYGEIYDRTVGHPLRLPRGRNALWKDGGLLVPMPVQ